MNLFSRLLGILIFCLFLAPAARAADFAAAFLETGIGARGTGMGSALVAAATDASASYWNPAGILQSPGRTFLVSHQPLSLDRRQTSVCFALNSRRDLGFGLIWLHAGVGDLQGRAGDGRPTGKIEDAENAYFISVSRALGSRLAFGVTMKIFKQSIDVPSRKKATGSGHGFDLGVHLHLTKKTALAAVVRNLDAELSWKVERSAQHTSSTEDPLPRVLVLGAAHRPFADLLLAADLHLLLAAGLPSNIADRHLNLGGEWTLSPVLTLRAGLNRVPGYDRRAGSITAGLTLRPMRRENLQFHYAYAADALEAGARTIVGLTVQF